MKNYFNLYGWINITASLTLFYFGITNQNLKPHEKLIVCLFAIIIVGIYCVVLVQLNKQHRYYIWVICWRNKEEFVKQVHNDMVVTYTLNVSKAIKFETESEANSFIYNNINPIRNFLTVKKVYL